MNVTAIIVAVVIVAVLGLLIGILLGVVAKVFAVEVDEKEVAIRELLPGNNCGGCGYAGCDALAAAIAKGEANPGSCPVGGAVVAAQIGEITGTDVEVVRKVAFVQCAGTCDKAPRNYEYVGNMSCKEAAQLTGTGDKACKFGCLGYGSCEKVCTFGALTIRNGIAYVNKELCRGDGKCAEECPRHLITVVPYDAFVKVRCSSTDKGKAVKVVCSTGCIGCKLCEKNCPTGAITVENNIARIDYTKCSNCGTCAQKCPSKIIIAES